MKMYPLHCDYCNETTLYSKKDFHSDNDGPTSTYYKFYCKKCGKPTGEWSLSNLINYHNVGYIKDGRSVVIKM